LCLNYRQVRMVLLRSVVLLGLVVFCQDVNSASHGTHFCYKDLDCSPTTWSGVCQTGASQSPINIPAASSNFVDATTADLHLNPCYSQLQNFSLENNGHTAQVALKADMTSTCTMTGGLLQETYTFGQMHFHWGSTDDTGSEHSVNGHKYVMEGHLVHYKSKFGNITQAAASKELDALTVLGVFFELSPTDNPALEPIILALGGVRSAEAKGHVSHLALAKFLEVSSTANVDVVQYDGSLTTPGCDEVVLWNVFRRPQPISQAQLAAFRRIEDGSKRPLVDNDRPLQKLNGREIRYYRTSVQAQSDSSHHHHSSPLALLKKVLHTQ